MSDFDTVLERLLTDAGFKAALATDPARALAGYDLSPDERDLLRTQVSTDRGGEREVEQRTSKASLFGMLSSSLGGAGLGRAAESAAHAGQGVAHGLGPADVGTVHSGGRFAGLGEHLDDLAHDGQGSLEAAPPPPPPAGYHPHIDVNGDGRWDAYTAVGRADGGVDLVADMDHDGRPDFIGHDLNHDGLVESADYDKDHDGVFENHKFDVNGDGWLDKTVIDPPAPTIPQSVAEELRFGTGG